LARCLDPVDPDGDDPCQEEGGTLALPSLEETVECGASPERPRQLACPAASCSTLDPADQIRCELLMS